MQGHYNRRNLADALRAVGMRRGDVVFSHSNIGYFGLLEEGRTPQAVFSTILGAFQDVLGPEGTLVVPTFTYSFCRQQMFDPNHTPSTCGAFTEMLRQLPASRRSRDPIFSVAAVGARADELTRDVPLECFGPGSFWDQFLQLNGLVCNLNCDAGSTFIHHVERQFRVPYRYDKLFTGQMIESGQVRKTAAIFFCQDLSNPDTVAAFEPFDALARARGFARTARVGRGAVVAVRATDTVTLLRDELPRNPWFLTTAAKTGKTPILQQPVGPTFALRPNAPAQEILETLWRLPRDIVSDGYDAALQALATQVPMTIHEYPTGTHCWTWLVPEKWTCQEAYLETLAGHRLFSYTENPLHVVSFSLPFEGEVPREELLKHLHVHPKLPGAVPFVFKYYDQDWGLCCSRQFRDALNDEAYRVVIKISFSFGSLKVGEVVVPGRTDENFVLCAHLDHPGMVNDDLAGVLAGLDVMRELLRRPKPRYTYRFLILPETIGSVAWLSHHEELVPLLKGGLFLEMLATPHPHALQLSYRGDTEVDRCLVRALKRRDPQGWTGAFRTVIGNDERQFNAPGVRVPMLSLSRVLPSSHPDWPYREYHSSEDTPANARMENLAASRDMVLAMIDELEQNRVVVNNTKGEVFCSRYGIHIDFYTNPEGNRALFDIMYRIDGTRSVADIADELRISPEAVTGVVEKLTKHGLVGYTPS
jgi:aminopeptidase-like protein/aminoglycoside N3'-acetyltransferase